MSNQDEVLDNELYKVNNTIADASSSNKLISGGSLKWYQVTGIALDPRSIRKRLVISHLVFHNFKSYGGIKKVGPFHQGLTGIVGPNGSGKSNVIDALLFVFGKRASNIRLKKVSELVHNSKHSKKNEDEENAVEPDGLNPDNGNLPRRRKRRRRTDAEPSSSEEDHQPLREPKRSRTTPFLPSEVQDETDEVSNVARITVYFQEIEDSQDGKYTIIKNSLFTVSRECDLKNRSSYMINDQSATFASVNTLLQAKGIDLVHNRFLILQGEVEQIALMPPKGSAKTDGMLEYLEDVIGTTDYRRAIEAGEKDLAKLHSEKNASLESLRIAEKDRDSLTEAKDAVVSYYRSLQHFTSAQVFSQKKKSVECEEKIVEDDAQLAQLNGELAETQLRFEELFQNLEKMTEVVRQTTVKHDETLVVKTQKDAEFQTLQENDEKLQSRIRLGETRLQEAIQSCEDLVQTLVSQEAQISAFDPELKSLEEACAVAKESTSAQNSVYQKLEAAVGAKLSKHKATLERLYRDVRERKDESKDAASDIRKYQNSYEILEKEHEEAKVAYLSALETNQNKKRQAEQLPLRIQSLQDAIAIDSGELEAFKGELLQNDRKMDAEKQTLEYNQRELHLVSQGGCSKNLIHFNMELEKRVSSGELPNTFGRLGGLCETHVKYTRVMQITCGSRLNNILANSSQDHEKILGIAKRSNVRTNIINLTRFAHRNFRFKPFDKSDLKRAGVKGEVNRVFDVITFDDTPAGKAASEALKTILKDYMVAETKEDASIVCFKFGFRCVTLEGVVFSQRGTVTGGGNKKASKPRAFTQMKMIDDQKKRRDVAPTTTEDPRTLQGKVKACFDVLNERNSVRSSLLRDIAETEAKIHEKKLEINKAELDIKVISSHLASQGSRMKEPVLTEQAQLDMANFNEQIQETITKKTELDRQVDKLNAQILKIKNEVENMQGKDTTNAKKLLVELEEAEDNLQRDLNAKQLELSYAQRIFEETKQRQLKATVDQEGVEQALEADRKALAELEDKAFTVLSDKEMYEQLYAECLAELNEAIENLKLLELEGAKVQAIVTELKTSIAGVAEAAAKHRHSLSCIEKELEQLLTNYERLPWEELNTDLANETEDARNILIVQRLQAQYDQQREERARVREQERFQRLEALKLSQNIGDIGDYEIEDEGEDDDVDMLDCTLSQENARRVQEVEQMKVEADVDLRTDAQREYATLMAEHDQNANLIPQNSTGWLSLFELSVRGNLKRHVYNYISNEGLESLVNRLKVRVTECDTEENLLSVREYHMKRVNCKEKRRFFVEKCTAHEALLKEQSERAKVRYSMFMHGFNKITHRLKELYQMLTLGGDAELELVDNLDPFSEGVMFSVRPNLKTWKKISHLSGGEKTLASLAFVFALHHYNPTPLYILDEIDAALDFKNVSIIANYIKRRTERTQFIFISLRSHMFELADSLIGIYKVDDISHSMAMVPLEYKKSKRDFLISSQ